MYRCPFSPAFATISSGERASIGAFAGGATGSDTAGGVDSTTLAAASGVVAASGLVGSLGKRTGGSRTRRRRDRRAGGSRKWIPMRRCRIGCCSALRSRPAAATQRTSLFVFITRECYTPYRLFCPF